MRIDLKFKDLLTIWSMDNLYIEVTSDEASPVYPRCATGELHIFIKCRSVKL